MSTTTDSTPAELIPGFSPTKLRTNLETQLEELRKAHDATYDLQLAIDALLQSNPWPEGATLPNVDRFDLEYHVLHVKIPPASPSRPWRGLNGTAGIVYRLRKFFKIARLERANTFGTLTTTDPSNPPDPYTQFIGSTTFGLPPTYATDPNYSHSAPTNQWIVYIYVDGQMPPTCRLEEVFGIDPTPRKHYKVVCK